MLPKIRPDRPGQSRLSPAATARRAALPADAARFQAMAETVPNILFSADAAGAVDYVNGRFYDYTGLPPGAALGAGWEEALHPDDRAPNHERWRQALAAGERYESEYRLRAADGSYRWFVGRSQPARDAAGRIIAWIGSCTDIDDHKRAEQAQRFLAEASSALASSLDSTETLARVARLAVSSLASYCFVDLVTAAGSLERVAVAHADPALEAAAQGLIRYPSDMANPHSVVARVIRTGRAALVTEMPETWVERIAQDAEHLQLLRDLQPLSCLAAPLIARGQTLGALVFYRSVPAPPYGAEDVAPAEELARRAALAIDNARLYETAQAAQARYGGLFNGVDDAIIVADAAGRFVEANAAATTLLGYSREELLRMRVGDLGAADRATSAAQFATLRRAGRWRGEVELRRKDGTLVPAESWQTVVQVPATTLYVAVWRDISERRALERQQREFAAMVSHELKGPLTAVRASAQLMRRRGAYSERAVDVIIDQSNRLGRLIDDLLDVARLEAGRLDLRRERLDLVELVERAVEGAQALSAAHRLRLEAPDDLVLVGGDRDRLTQVLQNLLTNAIKYSPAGGEIRVRVAPSDGQARVSVADQGIGVPPAALPRLFERFYRTEQARQGAAEGLGLGLYISKGIVEAHGGRIWAESTPDAGSTFIFWLPRD